MQGTFSSTQTSKISSNCWIANRNDHFHAKIRQNDHILGLLGGIEIRYWNLVLVFPQGKNQYVISIPVFFQYLPVNFSSISRKISVNIAKYHQFHKKKIIKITHIAWKWAILTEKFVFYLLMCCFHGKNCFWYQKIQ